MQKDGGSIICLLNAETIKNPYSNERKTLVNKLEELNASIEYIENAFVSAEHKTGVEIALIKVFIPEKEKVSYIFEELRNSERYEEVKIQNEYQLVTDDFIDEIVKQYNIEVQAGIKLINEYIAMSPYILQDMKETQYKSDPILKLCITGDSTYSNSLSVNNFIKKVRIKYWTALFDNPKFTKKMTSNLISEYHNKINELQEYDFSVYNIYQIKIEMSKNLIAGVEDTLINLFDELSHQHSWYDTSKNIHYYNGWKTNKAWYINKKVIIPYMNAFNNWDNSFNPDYGVKQKLNDIERTLNYLDGNRTMNIDLYERLDNAKLIGKTSKIELKYFRVTFYKKGTCHLEFTNEELLKKFNIYGSQKKGWLPPSYGKKTYEEMDQEEKEVINEFEGKESYNKTFINKDYYIVNNSNLLLLD